MTGFTGFDSGHVSSALARRNHTVVAGIAGASHLCMIDQRIGRCPGNQIVAGLAFFGAVDVHT